ncbi:hypothetical protein [Bosea vaviloviae]|uniref:Uncharacterized protein n=1 Tax=Bosea vaviloviae TaxID=1526658 RepID=A0A0N0MBU6_9HYPH|nr:hypothetical protein [Bosea vaviloviae]KPH81377.1 hypothetical protein AE618_08545 [Bosea vaviloviae]
MTKKPGANKSEGNRANLVLNARSGVNWARNVNGRKRFSYRSFRHSLGAGAPAMTSIYRLANSPLEKLLGPRTKYDDIAGLNEQAIKAIFPTEASRAAMRMEWLLRSASYNLIEPARAMLLLSEAEGVLEHLDEKASGNEECRVDWLCRSSLGAQIPTYKAGAPNISPERKVRLFEQAQTRLAECAAERLHVLRNIEAPFTEKAVSVRMETLAFFVEYNLRNQRQSNLKAMAERISEPVVLKAVKLATGRLGDPRIPLNFAEAAGYVAMIEHGGKADAYNKKAEAMIQLMLDTANHTGPIREFAPAWMPEGYDLFKTPELEAAIRLIEASEKE